MRKAQRTLAVAFLVYAAVTNSTWAKPSGERVATSPPIASLQAGAVSLEWLPLLDGDYDRIALAVAGPGGLYFQKDFERGQTPWFSLFENEGGNLPDGTYAYELRVIPRVDPRFQKRVAKAREAGEEGLAELLQAERRQTNAFVQSGYFSLRGGSLFPPRTPATQESSPRGETQPRLGTLTAKDIVEPPGDLIVQGYACIGHSCASGNATQALVLKDSFVGIWFQDTPDAFSANRDWMIQINDFIGGSERFSVFDGDAATTPFTILGNAPDHSLYVSSNGNLGLGTSTPAQDVHVVSGNSPTIRLDQDATSGFTPQKWDVGGNETGFFVKDITNSSKIPLRILPGAPTSSIHVASNGNVGIGTATPTQELTVKSRAANENVIEVQRSQPDNQVIMRLFETTAGAGLMSLFNDVAGETARISGSGGVNWFSGKVGINCNPSGAFDFGIKSGFTSGTACNTGTFSQINAGSTTFTASSSRTIKDNLQVVRLPDVLDKIATIDVYTYDFIDGPKDKLGLMAEDFHQVFGRGSDKLLNGQEVEMALWLAVKELTKRNDALSQRLAEMEAQLKRQQP